MNRKEIDTLIIDLDNTIYDWFAIWYASFCPIYNAIIEKSGASEEIVQRSIREVHQRRRTSEYTLGIIPLKQVIIRGLGIWAKMCSNSGKCSPIYASITTLTKRSRQNRNGSGATGNVWSWYRPSTLTV